MKHLKWIIILGFLIVGNAVASPAMPPFVPTEKPYFGYIELLRWQMREGGTDNWAQVIPAGGEQVNIQSVDAPFEWTTGIRMGAGRTFGNQNDFSITFTHYQSTATNQASGMVYSSFVANYFADNTNGVDLDKPFEQARIRWQFLFNTADFDLGHRIDLNQILFLHPHVGIKVAQINQKIYTNWMNPIIPTTFTVAAENLKNNFWGVGPSVGVDSQWPLMGDNHQSIQLVGNLAGGLIVGHWNFSDLYTNNTPTTIRVNVSSVNGLSPMLAGLLGLEWQRQFVRSDISVRLGYEEQIWFNQLQFYSLDMGRANRPTSLQGYNVEFRATC